jgi:hypothetical protein
MTASFKWNALVLNEVVSNADKSSVYSLPMPTSEWLSSTAIVQSASADIQAVTTQAIAGKSSALDKMSSIINWTSTNIKYVFHPELDAASTLRYRESTCTGYANLAAAMGRAAGIPSITLAGYLVGQPQETHWINEFYLGSDLGWRRVEPQGKLTTINEDYLMPVRIDRASEEIDWQYTKGIPLNSYPMAPVSPRTPTVTPEVLQEFLGKPDDMRSLFSRARTEWQKDFQTMISGAAISTGRIQLRNKFVEVITFEDLDSLLHNLEAEK